MLGVRYLLSIPVAVIQVFKEFDLNSWLLLVQVVIMICKPLIESFVNASLLYLLFNQFVWKYGPSPLDIALEPMGRGKSHFRHYVYFACSEF